MAGGFFGRQTSWLLVIAVISPRAEAQVCYYPDGGPGDPYAVPCNAGRHSMCCQLSTSSSSPDFCRPDGLCQDAQYDEHVWRESCTDPTWQAPECLKLCTMPGNSNDITFCSDQSVCCGFQNATCCRNGHGVWIQNGQVVSSPPTLRPSSSALSSQGVPSSTLLLPTPSPAFIHTGLTQGEKIGLGVGVGVGVLMILVIGFLVHIYVLERHRRKWLEMRVSGRQDENVIERVDVQARV